MLSILGFLMIAVFMFLIMSKRLSAIVALIIIPVLFALVGLITNFLPLTILFMIAFALALMINYPSLEEQKERISAHAGNALGVAAMVFAAGIFTGILQGRRWWMLWLLL